MLAQKTSSGMRHAGPKIMLKKYVGWSRTKCRTFRCGGLRVVGWVWVKNFW